MKSLLKEDWVQLTIMYTLLLIVMSVGMYIDVSSKNNIQLAAMQLGYEQCKDGHWKKNCNDTPINNN